METVSLKLSIALAKLKSIPIEWRECRKTYLSLHPSASLMGCITGRVRLICSGAESQAQTGSLHLV